VDGQPLQHLGLQQDLLYQGGRRQLLVGFLQLLSVNLIYRHHGEDEVRHGFREVI
jgi:hypothetical protein